MFKKFVIITWFPMFALVMRYVPWDRLPSTCIFLRITGLPCPTCGITRSAIGITHLNFGYALQMNPLGFPLVGFAALWWVVSVYEKLTARKTWVTGWTMRNLTRLAVAGLVILLLFGLDRIRLLTR